MKRQSKQNENKKFHQPKSSDGNDFKLAFYVVVIVLFVVGICFVKFANDITTELEIKDVQIKCYQHAYDLKTPQQYVKNMKSCENVSLIKNYTG